MAKIIPEKRLLRVYLEQTDFGAGKSHEGIGKSDHMPIQEARG
jgi:hypothetical protein